MQHEQAQGLYFVGHWQHEQARATVFSLADLSFEFGEKYTAAELYEYFVSCRVIAKRRERKQRGYH